MSKHKHITPKIFQGFKVFKDNLKQLHKNGQIILSLISLPKIISQLYVSAQNTKINNILKFSDTEENQEQEKSNREFQSILEEIKHRNKIKSSKKKMCKANL